jgi:hypothetical protein
MNPLAFRSLMTSRVHRVMTDNYSNVAHRFLPFLTSMG